MKDFLRILRFKTALIFYGITFLCLTMIADYVGYGYYGLELSVPVILVSLVIDLSVTYYLYKKWRN